jgi:hypothetical protein
MEPSVTACEVLVEYGHTFTLEVLPGLIGPACPLTGRRTDGVTE